MGQCRTLDADVTIGCYYGDYKQAKSVICLIHLMGVMVSTSPS